MLQNKTANHGNRVKKYTRTAGGHWETITYIDGIIEYRENDASDYQSISHVVDTSTSSVQAKRIATIREGKDFGDSTPAIKYNLDDHLGSSNVLVDENGTLVNFEEYYPFGETSFGSYAKKRYRFCGKEKDSESGMYYYGARYYSPWLCRFVSVDPLAGDYPFLSPFQYAGNQPINFIDLDGMEQAPTNENSSNVTPTPPAPTQGNNSGESGGEQNEATGSLKGCCVTEPTVNGNQGPYSAEYVKQQQQANKQKQAAEAEKAKQEQKKLEFIKNMNNPEFMTKFYLERALEGVEKVSENTSSAEMISPVKDPIITSGIGERDVKSVKGASKNHKGVDIQIASPGVTNEAPVISPVNGIVVDIQNKNQGSAAGKKAGNRIVIKDSKGMYHHFFHLADKDFAKGFKKGMPVSQGSQIGRIGNTSTLNIKVHLHYEIRGGMYTGTVFNPSKINSGLK